jgi:hypothetical protein
MDERTYIRLHDGMPDHPKVVGLSHAAFRLYVESLCWSSRHLTDGVVSAAALRRMGGWSPAAVKELAAAELYEMGDSAGWLIHDYTEHQRTADEVADYRKSKRAAGTTGNHERWHVARGIVDPSCDMCAIDDASHVRSHEDPSWESQTESQTDRKSSPETETETDKEERKKRLAHIGSDDDPDFTAFWAAYPRKVGKGQARKAWRSATLGRHVDPKILIVASEHFRDEARRRRIEEQYIPHPATWLNGERYSDSPSGEDATPRRFDYPDSPYDRGN